MVSKKTAVKTIIFILAMYIASMLNLFLFRGIVNAADDTLIVVENAPGRTVVACPDDEVAYTFAMAMWSDINTGSSGEVYTVGRNTITLELDRGAICTARVRLLDANAQPVKECKLPADETYFTAGFDPYAEYGERAPVLARVDAQHATRVIALNALGTEVKGEIVCGGESVDVVVPANGCFGLDVEESFPGLSGEIPCLAAGAGLSLVSAVNERGETAQ